MIHYSKTKTIHDNEARYILLIPSLTSEKPLPHFNSEIPESVFHRLIFFSKVNFYVER